jgi:signal transduction histidine kinase
MESVTHIQQASADALDDLRLTVGLLREPGAGDPVEPPQPVAGLGQLDELIGSFASTGLRVTREVTGQERPLPEPVSLTAYRVIQESLTNTRKHAATGWALVRLGYTPETLRVAVEDAGSQRPPAAGSAQQGHGIIGMRERVTALGGRLSAGPQADGGFRVVAELPLPGAGS